VSGKRVFITGVAGFLGSHIAKRHLTAGDVVHGVDNFSSSRRDSRHLLALRASKRFYARDFDVCTHSDSHDTSIFPGMVDILYEGLDCDGPYDVVYNMACPASPPIYQRIPIETTLTCTLGMHHVLNGVRGGQNGTVVVHASTSEVYGDPETSPQVESYPGRVHSWGPRACYDEGKRAAEAICYDYRQKHGLDVRLVRIFNTYGPHMDPDDGRVVTNLVKQVLRGESLTVYGDGQQTRSFCYVDDLVDGITRLASLPKEQSPDHPINLGNPEEFTVLDLAKEVIRQVPGTGSSIIYDALPIHDPMQRRPDITQAKKYLKGWEPKVSLSEGLSRLIPYMRQELGL
jgi:UDP-glucuronate decarboxylase